MSRVTRSTYTVIELGPDGFPARSYNAVITPYYAGSAPPGYQEPVYPEHPISGIPDFPHASPPIYVEGYPPGWSPPIWMPKPPDVDPPGTPPPNCNWVYSDKGWVLVCGPYEGGKPRPPADAVPPPAKK